LPHDGEARELQTGKSRKQFLEERNFNVSIVPRHEPMDGIDAARVRFNRMWFDAEKCARGIDCLRMYRSEFDDKNQVLRPRPLHDWASHGADAFRCGVMADTEVEGSDLSAIIADELRQAQTFDQTKRALALEYMRGEMRDLPARVNGSSQTTRVVADAVSWILPGTVRVFTASDQMVEFEATQEGGEQGAEEATDYTNYSFFRENDGYRILYNATHDGLLMGNGAACSYWCPEESKSKLFRNKTEEEIATAAAGRLAGQPDLLPSRDLRVTLKTR
jgi:hypothetical protein